MVNLASILLAVLPLTHIIDRTYGLEIGERDLGNINGNMLRAAWDMAHQVNGNELGRDVPVEELLKGAHWTFYPNAGKPTFARESRSSESLLPRVGRDEEIQFTETSRSPPFAPRLGRMFHYSPKFRRISLS